MLSSSTAPTAVACGDARRIQQSHPRRAVTAAATAALLCLAASSLADVTAASPFLPLLVAAQFLSSPEYSYQPQVAYGGQSRDPDSWGAIADPSDPAALLFPMCSAAATGRQQSPIAITAATVDRSLAPLEAVSDAYPALDGGVITCEWWTNGADLRLTSFASGSSNTGNTNGGGGQLVDPEDPSPRPFKSLEYIGVHLGAGHAIGGTHADLELSFVFAPQSTVNSGNQLTIVSVIATSGSYSSHKLLGELLADLPVSWGPLGVSPPSTPRTHKVPYRKGKTIDYRTFMPGRRAYFVYEGTELSPPCRPARVYVMETPIHVSHRQLALLRNRTGAVGVPPRADMAGALVGTARPPQPLLSSSSSSSSAGSGAASSSSGGVRKYEEIFISTVFDDKPSSYRGESSIVAMGACAIAIGIIGAIISALVIYQNWLEILKLPTNYGVGADRSLLETIQQQGGGAGYGGGDSSSPSGGRGGKKGSGKGGKDEKGGGKRKSGGGGDVSGRYIKGLPAAAGAHKDGGGQSPAAGLELYN